MKSQTFSIPNLFSLGNLLCGCFAILKVTEGDLVWAVYLVGIACVMDFLDGFAARVLKMPSPMGKELDSLADMVTFGVVPGAVMFVLLKCSVSGLSWMNFFAKATAGGFGSLWSSFNRPPQHSAMEWLPYIAFMIPAFSALRLAKFNVDKRQTEGFIGLPTLANCIFITSLPMIFRSYYGLFDNDPNRFGNVGEYVGMSYKMETASAAISSLSYLPWVLAGITIIFSLLLLSPIPMFSFKVKSVKWKGNEIRYIFLALAIGLIVGLKWAAAPAVIVLYILLSVVSILFRRKQAPGS